MRLNHDTPRLRVIKARISGVKKARRRLVKGLGVITLVIPRDKNGTVVIPLSLCVFVYNRLKGQS